LNSLGTKVLAQELHRALVSGSPISGVRKRALEALIEFVQANDLPNLLDNSVDSRNTWVVALWLREGGADKENHLSFGVDDSSDERLAIRQSYVTQNALLVDFAKMPQFRRNQCVDES
jgi:hypothetical protein